MDPPTTEKLNLAGEDGGKLETASNTRESIGRNEKHHKKMRLIGPKFAKT